MATFSTVQPVFLKQNSIPDCVINRPSVLEMCLAAERTSGQGSILGAQEIRGLWRIYPATREARTELLVKGLRLRNTSLQVSNSNPFILRDDTGEEKPTTKLWIDNIPISVAESEIEHVLVKVGCELRSAIKMERARDADNKLTRFLTGRRFVFITVPPTPLDKTLKINIFTAKVYHKEQKSIPKSVICSRCLQPNHHVSQCTNEVVCRECKQTGHKRGDPRCEAAGKPEPAKQPPSPSKDNANKESTSQSRKGGGKSDASHDRSRASPRQSTLLSALDRAPRNRSGTPKRGRSKERRSPLEKRKDKYPRRRESRSASPEFQEARTDSESVTADQRR